MLAGSAVKILQRPQDQWVQVQRAIEALACSPSAQGFEATWGVYAAHLSLGLQAVPPSLAPEAEMESRAESQPYLCNRDLDSQRHLRPDTQPMQRHLDYLAMGSRPETRTPLGRLRSLGCYAS